jgi:hypothetical protein
VTSFKWEQTRSEDYQRYATAYAHEFNKQRKRLSDENTLAKPPTKPQLRYISHLRRERDFVVKMFPTTRAKASQLIRELEAAPLRDPFKD